MNVQCTISQMCKSARAMGLSKSRWLLVEDHLTNILKSSGPEFTIQFLKELKEAKIHQMVGEPYDLDWHRKSRDGSPAGWQKILWKFAKPKTSIQILGALINAIQLDDMSSKQYQKWMSGVRVNRKPNAVADSTSRIFKEGKWISRSHQRRMSSDFLHNFANHTVFSIKDLTGASIPVGSDSLNVTHRLKRLNDLEKRVVLSNDKDRKTMKALYDEIKSQGSNYLSAYLRTLQTAPIWAANMEVELIDLCDKRKIPVKDKAARLMIAEHIRKYNDDVPGGYDVMSLDGMGQTWSNETSIYPGSNGHVAFLQQPGGKMRTICNPNRYSQHVLRPLQKSMFNHQFLKMKTNSVFNQSDGIAWAQQKLQEGHELASMDLSSATDLLNSQAFINNVLVSHLDLDDPLYIALEYFEIAAKGNWEVPALHRQIAFTEGQPLGLGPSFPLLTLQNTCAAMLAVEQGIYDGIIPLLSYDDCFRVVGDDMIILSELKDYYASNISAMGGEANPEKALLSNRYAEFCSQMITTTGSWPLKPKIRGTLEYVLIDSETATSYAGLMSEFKKSKKLHYYESLAEALSQYSGDNSLNNLPSIRSSVHVSDKRKYAVSLVLDAFAKEAISMPSGHAISSLSTFAAYALDESSIGYGWTVERFRFLENLGKVSTSGDVIPTRINKFNHHSGEYEAPEKDPVQRYRALKKALDRMVIVEDNNSVVVSATIPNLPNQSVEVAVDAHDAVLDYVYTPKTSKGHSTPISRRTARYTVDLPGLNEHRLINKPKVRIIPSVSEAEAEMSAKPKNLQSPRPLRKVVKKDVSPSLDSTLSRNSSKSSTKTRSVDTKKDVLSMFSGSNAELLKKWQAEDKEDNSKHIDGLWYP